MGVSVMASVEEKASAENSTVNKKKRDGLSRPLRMFYGIGDLGFTFMSNVETYFFNFFLTNLAQFSLPIVSVITTITSTVDAVTSWMYGAILNSINPKKWGRYRSWLILLPWIVPFLYAFQFIKLGDGILSVVVIVVATIVSHIAWNIPWVANASMIAVAGKTPEERAHLSSMRAFWTNLSKIFFSYIATPMAAVFAGVIGETNQYGAVAFVFGCLMAVLYFAHFKMFDGYEEVDVELLKQKKGERKKKEDKGKTSPSDLLRALAQNPPLIFLLISDLAKYMFNFVVAGTATYYFVYVAQDATLTAAYIMIANIFAVIGSYVAKTLIKKLSVRTTTFCTYIAMGILLIAAFLVYTNVWLVIALMSLTQAGYGIVYACGPALYSDTIIYSEWKTGKNATGWISGLQTVPLKIGVVTRGIIITACLALGGFVSDMDPSLATTGLQQAVCLSFMVVPAIALFIGGLLMIFGYRLTQNKVVMYQEEIAARSNKTDSSEEK